MKEQLVTGLLLCCTICSCTDKVSYAPNEYAICTSPWNEALGNHRSVFSVSKSAEAVKLSVDWRRHDLNVGNHRFLVVNAESGDTVANIKRLQVNNERCELICGPIEKSGIYFFYYLPYQVQKEPGFYQKDYDRQEPEPSTKWLQGERDLSSIPSAELIRLESRTPSDSFYPMEVIATEAECVDLKLKNPADFWVFPEDRSYPIRMKDKLPYKWIQQTDHSSFTGEALQNEYYTFQLGVWAGVKNIHNVTYKTSGLQSGANIIGPSSITCFNLEGVNPSGQAFTKQVDVPKGQVQPLWFGVDIAKDQPAGTYRGNIIIQAENGHEIPIDVAVKVKNKVLVDRGDSETWRHSRLRWLNSTLGISDKPTSGYENIKADSKQFSCTGKSLQLIPETGLPQQIRTWGNDLLAAPVQFIIETDKGIQSLKGSLALHGSNEGMADYVWRAENESMTVKAKIRMEFDGWVNYIYTLNPKRDVHIRDVRLEIPLSKEYSSYIMGMGLHGQYTPDYYKGKWSVAEEKINKYGASIAIDDKRDWLWPFDSFWCGSEKAGIHCELRGADYTGPLLNLYRPDYPASWFNDDKGGFEVKHKNNETVITTYSGSRTLKENESIDFNFAFLITPVKQINWAEHFTNRYYHSIKEPTPDEQNIKDGVRVINIHGGRNLVPFINYPTCSDKLKDFVHTWQNKECKVKLYYTVRELSNAADEIWALRSLGDEILADGNGGGYPWCREHFVTGYTPQWYTHFGDELLRGYTAEGSILTSTGESRWYNYYIEGLQWLARNTGMDGIYMDDVAFERDIVKRIRHALEEVKPGCIIDLHSNTGFSRGPVIHYATFFPYLNRLWLGESYMYSEMSPDNWLVEVSGIPFGLTSDMLHRGGNPWLGMQYGMTVRQDWVTDGILCNPRYIWRFWDKFGIKDAKVEGFWEKNPVATTNNENVKATAFIKKGCTLISIGNYGEEDTTIKIDLNWNRIGLDQNNVEILAPAIEDFQEECTFTDLSSIPVSAKKGWLILVKAK